LFAKKLEESAEYQVGVLELLELAVGLHRRSPDGICIRQA